MSAQENIARVKTYLGSKAVWSNLLILAAVVFPALGKWTGSLNVDELAGGIASVFISVCALAAIVFRGQATGPLVASKEVAQIANQELARGVPLKQAVKTAKRAA